MTLFHVGVMRSVNLAYNLLRTELLHTLNDTIMGALSHKMGYIRSLRG